MSDYYICSVCASSIQRGEVHLCTKPSPTLNEFNVQEPPQLADQKHDETRALRYDTGKSRVDLIDPTSLEALGEVLAYGAKKYAEWNWAKGMPWNKVIGSLLRHTYKFQRGQDNDEESGLPNVDLIFCNAMFLVYYYRFHKDLDNRHKPKSKNST